MPASVRPVPGSTPILEAKRVSVTRGDTLALDDVSLRVAPGERWAVMGPNGSGKSTLVAVLSLGLHPSRGEMSVLGKPLGTFDVRRVRPRIALASPGLLAALRPALTAREAVMTALRGALETWWHSYDDADRARAEDSLAETGAGHLAGRALGSLSSGEAQRVMLARALVADPLAVILDEPGSRLDLAGRESLVSTLDALAAARPSLPIVSVTHHVEEIPASTTHALLLARGRHLVAGTAEHAITSTNLSACFGIDLVVERGDDGRLSARAR